jgi:hypothetical protein
MMSFSLFHRPRFDQKLLRIASPLLLNALLASIFTFSSRYCQVETTHMHGSWQGHIPPSKYFHDLAMQFTEEALNESPEDTPSLCLLQALVLTTFQQLIHGVRGRAWRSLGTCVRIAYELRLHLVDSESDDRAFPTARRDIEQWSRDEERRRTWWVIWEFDVFASTVRRLPAAIDWTQNETCLPVDDEHWFNDNFHPSCFLEHEPTSRWKELEKSGNKSGKAWFIVVNSIMRNAQIVSNPWALTSEKRAGTSIHRSAERAKSELDILENTMACYTMALPSSLAYREEYLSFKAVDTFLRRRHCDIHNIHTMTQLAHLMINHYEVFWSSTREPIGEVRPDFEQSDPIGTMTPTTVSARRSWHHYLDAVDRIISLVRNCASIHVRHVNPLLASTIWLAAAAQVVSKVFGPLTTDQRITESKKDLLTLNFHQYVDFWDAARELQSKLDTLETRLQIIRAPKAKQNIGKADGTQPDSGVNHHQNGVEPQTPFFPSFGQEGQLMTSMSVDLLNVSSLPPFSGVFDVPFLSTSAIPTGGFYDSYNFSIDDLLTYGCN